MDPDVNSRGRLRGTPLEVPVFNYQDALNAPRTGAKRIELNAEGSYAEGGLTPSLALFQRLSPAVECGIRIMIRPRGPPSEGHDFIYNDNEFGLMCTAIKAFTQTGLMYPIRGDGFVFGVLKESVMPEGEKKLVVDVDRCARLKHLAMPYACVFHRAFDSIAGSDDMDEIRQGINDIRSAGMHGILTSGGPGNYMDNIGNISRMLRYNDKLDLIIGGGVRSTNVKAAMNLLSLSSEVGGVWMHSSCITGDVPACDHSELSNLASELRLDIQD